MSLLLVWGSPRPTRLRRFADPVSLPLVSGKLQKIRKELQNGYSLILHHFVPPVKSRISGADWTVRFTGAYLVVFSGHLGDRGTFYGAPGETAKFFPLFSSFCPAPLTAPPRQFTIGAPQSEWNITGALGVIPGCDVERIAVPGPSYLIRVMPA
jgi:hypothetical protein